MGLASNRRCNCIHEYTNGDKVLGSGSGTNPYIHERAKIVDILDPYTEASLGNSNGIFTFPSTVQSIEVSGSGELTGASLAGQVSYDPGLGSFSVTGKDFEPGKVNDVTSFDVDSNGRIILVGIGDKNSAIPYTLPDDTQHLVNIYEPTRQISYCQIHDSEPVESQQLFFPVNVNPTTTGMFRNPLSSVLARTTSVVTRITMSLLEDNFTLASPAFTVSPVTPFTPGEYIEFEIFRIVTQNGFETETSVGKFNWSQNASRANSMMLGLLDCPTLTLGQSLSYVITVPKQLDSGNGRDITYRYSLDFVFV